MATMQEAIKNILNNSDLPLGAGQIRLGLPDAGYDDPKVQNYESNYLYQSLAHMVKTHEVIKTTDKKYFII